MLVHWGTDTLRAEWPRSVVCMGTFDGVHLGHQQVIREAVCRARERGLPAVVLTFDRHPAAILAPDRCPPALATLGQNLRKFEGLGVDVCLVLPFDDRLAATEAQAFFSSTLRAALRAEIIVIGHDFAFGHGRRGTPAWLADHIETVVVPPFELAGGRVSSSNIRAAVLNGDMERAHTMLGRPFSIEGIVIHGAQLGRKLGYPTANLARSAAQATPVDGVYAGTGITPFGSFRAAISVGVRPTIDEATRSIEAYLLDYKGESLYGHAIELMIERRLRAQVKFDDLESLKEQMARDVAAARG